MTAISYELFPIQTKAGEEKLQSQVALLAESQPSYFSITYGAGGSTRKRSLNTLMATRKATTRPLVPHIACIGDNKKNIHKLLLEFTDLGIERIIALRGDRPSGIGLIEHTDFQYASDLVSFTREKTGSRFEIGVAAYPEVHPQAISMDADIENLRRKIDAGANFAITQYFFNPDSYFYFVDRLAALGINIPVIPGIMPITNLIKLARFSDLCGAELPRWMRKGLESYGENKTAICQFGEEVITNMCTKLLTFGAPGLHFYTLNRAQPSLAIVQNLGLHPERGMTTSPPFSLQYSPADHFDSIPLYAKSQNLCACTTDSQQSH